MIYEVSDILTATLLGTFVGVGLVGVDSTSVDATDTSSNTAFIDELSYYGTFTSSVFLEGNVS